MPDAYLGRTADGKPLRYSINDLLTHGVCVGMTGSGKTGLCVGLLEELLLADTPLFLLDPKGDVTNLLLTFPKLRGEDFAPWVDPEAARRAGRGVEEEGAAQAKLWREGLGKWNVPLPSLGRLREKACYRVFTPGSRVGRPVDVLGSLELPAGLSFERDEEAVRDEIRGAVSGLLTLSGVEADPVSDARHIVLARILEARWREGKGAGLADLVALTENPPFTRIGAMDLDAVLPRARRREARARPEQSALFAGLRRLAGKANLWIPAGCCATARGRPACNLFYLAHLDDEERMFFVTRFLERFWGWTRTQSGATDLKTLLYFDEVFGYLPPVAEPPSKRPLLSLLKQARAFGVGLLVVTQNPVDLDYKALSNAGTWMVGRLQADRDKQRLLDGLDSASAGAAGRATEADRTLIAGLEGRRFLLHDVHGPADPWLFEPRWARAFLAGRSRGGRSPISCAGLPKSAPAGAAAPSETGAAAGGRCAALGRRSGAACPRSGLPGAVRARRAGRRRARGRDRHSGRGPDLPAAARRRRLRPRRLLRFGSGPVPAPATDGNTRLEDWSPQPPAGVTYGALPAWATKTNAYAALERAAKEQAAADGFTLETIPDLGLARQPRESDEDLRPGSKPRSRRRPARAPKRFARRASAASLPSSGRSRRSRVSSSGTGRSKRARRPTAASTWSRERSECCSEAAGAPPAPRCARVAAPTGESNAPRRT